jgi:hypothetical protein
MVVKGKVVMITESRVILLSEGGGVQNSVARCGESLATLVMLLMKLVAMPGDDGGGNAGTKSEFQSWPRMMAVEAPAPFVFLHDLVVVAVV